jgi:hypothetical protein
MKTNKKIAEFKTKIDQDITSNKARIDAQFQEKLTELKSLKFKSFTNESPLDITTVDVSNTIFLTYSDHYRGNSGTHMTIGYLGQPHTNMDDRGYIRGVAVDLSNFLKFKHMNVSSYSYLIANIRTPKFNKSKNSDSYKATINIMVAGGVEIINEYTNMMNDKINEAVKALTGCSLTYYIQTI